MERYKGGCVCGSVRFELSDHPLWIVACHCDPCKKRTGSAFGISMVVENRSVAQFSGPTNIFARRGDSGKEVRYEFCPKCGTTVRWHVDLISRQVFAGGALDQPEQLAVFGEMYAGDALPWARLGCELVRPGAPDDAFRDAMIEKAKSSHADA
jgi:hypothetical protein